MNSTTILASKIIEAVCDFQTVYHSTMDNFLRSGVEKGALPHHALLFDALFNHGGKYDHLTNGALYQNPRIGDYLTKHTPQSVANRRVFEKVTSIGVNLMFLRSIMNTDVRNEVVDFDGVKVPMTILVDAMLQARSQMKKSVRMLSDTQPSIAEKYELGQFMLKSVINTMSVRLANTDERRTELYKQANQTMTTLCKKIQSMGLTTIALDMDDIHVVGHLTKEQEREIELAMVAAGRYTVGFEKFNKVTYMPFGSFHHGGTVRNGIPYKSTPEKTARLNAEILKVVEGKINE